MTGMANQGFSEPGDCLDEWASYGATYPAPEDVLTQVAASNKYKYAVWNGQVLLVDRANKTVIDILHGDVLRDYDKPK